MFNLIWLNTKIHLRTFPSFAALDNLVFAAQEKYPLIALRAWVCLKSQDTIKPFVQLSATVSANQLTQERRWYQLNAWLILFNPLLFNLSRVNEDLNRIINCERGRREQTRSSFYIYMHIWNRLLRIKSVKLDVETSDKNQYSYILYLFLKMTWPEDM